MQSNLRLDLVHFTVAQRERAQQDLKVPYKVPHLTHPPFTYERQPQHRDHPTLIRIVRGFFNVPQNYQHSRNCEKTRKFNHLQMKLQRRHFSPQLFKDPECWSGRSLELTTSCVTARFALKRILQKNDPLIQCVSFYFSPNQWFRYNLTLIMVHNRTC